MCVRVASSSAMGRRRDICRHLLEYDMSFFAPWEIQWRFSAVMDCFFNGESLMRWSWSLHALCSMTLITLIGSGRGFSLTFSSIAGRTYPQCVFCISASIRRSYGIMSTVLKMKGGFFLPKDIQEAKSGFPTQLRIAQGRHSTSGPSSSEAAKE